MDNQELKDLTKKVFEEAESPADKDAVMESMFAAGIPFGKLQIMYKTVGIAEGYIADPAVVKAAITEHLDDLSDDLEFETWAEVEAFIDTATEEITGATPAQVTRMLRAFCKESDIELPKKDRASTGGPRKRGGALVNSMIEYANSSDKLNLTGMFGAIRPVVKRVKNAYDYTGTYFGLVYSIKNNVSLEQANKAMKQMTQLKLADLEKAEETERA